MKQVFREVCTEKVERKKEERKHGHGERFPKGFMKLFEERE